MQEILYLSGIHKIVNKGDYKIVDKLQRTFAVVILTAVLAVSASAGIIDSPGVVGTIDSPGTPAPTPSQTTTSTSTSMTTVILTILGLIR
jgi:hypothetical protein